MRLKNLVVLYLVLMLLANCKTGSSIDRIETEKIFGNSEVVDLVYAASRGDSEKVDSLVNQGVKVDSRGSHGVTPLIWVMRDKRKICFEILITHGANPNIQTDEGYSAMYFAAGADDPYYLQMALQHGGDPNLVDVENRESLLFMAIDEERLENIQLLIQAGANLNARNATGNTPLHAAAAINSYDIAFLLLQSGADYTIKNNFGITFLHSLERGAVDKSHPQYEWREKVVDFLRKKGVMVTLRNP